MLAGAVQQALKAAGLNPVSVGGFGDYTAGPPAWCVHVELGADATLEGDVYGARLQLRTRAANAIAAENAGRRAFDLVRALDGTELAWVDPTGEADRRYQVSAIVALQRPTWFPTPEPGEETSCNFQLLVREVVA